MAEPTGGTPRNNPSHAMLHNVHLNVRMFGAVGDGSTDDTAAITAAIAAGYSERKAVLFPPTATNYKITSTIDLTSYPGTRLVGGDAAGVTAQGGLSPQVSLAGSNLYPMFKSDSAGLGSNLVFENLGFFYASVAVRVSDGAVIRFKNCSFSPNDTADADNSCVLLENTFWVWFEDCAFTAPNTTEPAVLLKGKEPSPNVDHCYLINFRHCRFWNNGVLHKGQNDVTVDAAHIERITFEDCDTENFAGTSALIEFSKTASTNYAAAGRVIRNFSIRNCAAYDYTGTPAAVRFTPCSIVGAFAENVLFPRLFERPSGSSGVTRCFISGFQGSPFVDGSGTPLVTSIVGYDSAGTNIDFGTLGITGVGKITSALTSGSSDQLRIPDDTQGAGLWIGSAAIGSGGVALYRDGANYFGIKGSVNLYKGATALDAYTARVTGDSQVRWSIDSTGIQQWSAGSGSLDTNLYRAAANALQTDDVVRDHKGAPAYSASITPNATDGDWQTITVTNATAFTINAPTNAPDANHSQELTIEIFNNSGGAHGAITWNAAFVLVGGALAVIANTKKKFIAFKWNGASWIEVSRASADY